MNSSDKPGPLRSRPTGRELVTFGVVSLILLGSLAIAPAKNYFSDWRHYQKSYLKLASDRQAGTLVRSFHVGIRQTWIPKLGVVDRCESCHVNLNGALVGASAQPFRKHPQVPHDLEQFGCVLCHRGQGAATSVEEAHYATEAWEQPLLPARYLDSSCGQCHLGTLEGTPRLNQGRKLLSTMGCVHCHVVTQPDGNTFKPDDDPPPLIHIAEQTTREWIYAWIKDPQAYSSSATMPNFQFSDQDAADIASFLIAQSTPSAAAKNSQPSSPAQAPPADATAAASLYGSSFCSSCHAVQNAAGNLVGGDFGPELTRIGNKVNPDWLHAWLRDPGQYEPGTRMPHYRFDEKQITLLSSFLLAKKDSDFKTNALAPATPDSIAHGKRLVTESGCAACHQINGVSPPQNFAPDLSRVGSRALAQIVFAPGMKHNLPDYITAKIHDPRSFGPALKMPKFNLNDDQVVALTTALLAQTDRASGLPRELLISAERRSNYHPGGAAGKLMEDLRCQSCHTVNGRGGDMAPELTWEGSAVQRAWLEDFMGNPNTLRPALIRRMPKFNLRPAEIKTISEYILSAYQVPGADLPVLDGHTLGPDAASRGKQLFYTKYGCQACHIADYKTDKGYVGPALASVGNRLTPEWMYQWLKDPNAIRSGTLMPNPNVKDDEARDLTAFLMTLKAQQKGGAK